METTGSTHHGLATLPGPRGLPLLGNLHQLDFPRLHQQLEGWAHDFGPIYRIRIGPRTRVIISDCDAINIMLRERPETYRRPRLTEAVMEEMGFNGVFSRDGDAWQRQRRVVVQALSPTHLTRFYPAMRMTTERLLDRWSNTQGPFDLCRDLMRYTVDVTAHLAFGIDVNTLQTDGPVVQQHLDKVFPMLFRRVVAPFPYWRWVRTRADRELDAALAEIHRIVADMTRACRSGMRREPTLFEQPSNFLEAIIAAQSAEQVEFSDDEIYANVITLLLAGEDTTANTLAWAITFLVQHPALHARIRDEVDAVLGAANVAPDLAAIRQLEFVEAFALETMRFKPVAPIIALEPKDDVELLGYGLPTGTPIIALTRPNAISDDHFDAAASFDPTRWLAHEKSPAALHNPRAHIPFGAGPRFCPGRGLAMLEIKAVLAMLCRNFDVGMAGDAAQIKERLSFTMQPENLRVTLTPRAAATT